MILNVHSYNDILSKNGLSHEYVQKATGLSKKTYLWILDNGYIEFETLERIADVAGCSVNEIAKPDYEGFSENVIEWVKDQAKATVTLSQRRIITRVRNLAKSRPDDCQIVAENKDGSIVAHIPVNWVKISPLKKVSEEHREKARQNMKVLHLKRGDTTHN